MMRLKYLGLAFLVCLALFLTLIAGSYTTLMKYRFGLMNLNEPFTHKVLIAIGAIYDSSLMVIGAFDASLNNTQIRKESKLKDIHLKIEPNAIKSMASNLPDSAKSKYYKGKLLYPDGSWKKISLRFRGRNIWHWSPDKPSLRLKLSRSSPIDLQRHINLVNPEDITMTANYYSELLSNQLEVLTHKTEMVRLFIENKFFGVYQMTTREDENMLRINGRIPGPIFIGDRLGKIWKSEQFKIKGDFAKFKDVDPISKVIEAIYDPPSPERYLKLWRYLDREKMSRWIAMLNLSGGIHTDYVHNHSYYFDPTKGKLEPLTSDILGLGTLLYPGARDRLTKPYKPDYTLPINEKLHPLLDVALRDPKFYDLRNQVLYKALLGIASTNSQQNLMSSIYNKIDQDVKADRRKAFVMETFAGFFRMPYGNWQYEEGKRDALNWVEKRNLFIMSELEKSNVLVQISKNRLKDTLVQITIDGHAAAEIDFTRFSSAIISKDKSLNGNFQTIDKTALRIYPGLKEVDDFYYEQLKDRRVPKHYLFPGKQHYLFSFSGVSKLEIKKKLSSAFTNAVTKAQIFPEIILVNNIDPNIIKYNSISQHSWTFPTKKLTDIVLGPGVVNVLQTIKSNYGQIVRIVPGTTLRMAPNVSILARGPLKMEGKSEKPIEIERLNPKKKWGVIVAQGKLSSGSRIKNAKIIGGSSSKLINVNYSGMVSFYWSDDIKIESSYIGGNTLGDDTLHIVHSDVVLENVELSDCFGDCIDLDYSKLVVDDLRIRNAGNDGMDFMTSQANVKNTRISNIKDKGISGGENSKLNFLNLSISNSNIGIAAKDKSTVNIRNTQLELNEVGIDSYKKNWRYGGAGHVKAYNTKWNDNSLDIRVLDGGFVEIFEGPKPNNFIEDSGIIKFY